MYFYVSMFNVLIIIIKIQHQIYEIASNINLLLEFINYDFCCYFPKSRQTPKPFIWLPVYIYST